MTVISVCFGQMIGKADSKRKAMNIEIIINIKWKYGVQVNYVNGWMIKSKMISNYNKP